MTTLTIKIPDSKAKELSTYAKEIGGEIIAKPKAKEVVDEDEVTHEVYFGENIRRLIKSFQK